MNHLDAVIARQKAGEAVGVYSVCSAHPTVLEAALAQAADDGSFLLVEATSNQVDQFGGYTGMSPADFREFVHVLADAQGLPRDALVLGGDHLGPNRWQTEPADVAMGRAEDLVAAYVAAGYTKIHLDCSMSLGGDPVPIGDDLVAERAARLLAVAERTAEGSGSAGALRYVIGTEVPVPGGAHETLGELTPTPVAAARATLDRHRKAIDALGYGQAWKRIAALVVQPGVEFDSVQVVDYDRTRTTRLRGVLDDEPHMVFEAHSTDYQLRERLTELVEDHWAVLKVGPGLTFALREALFALAAIEDQLLPSDRSNLVQVVEQRMLEEPGQWERYYEGTTDERRLARRFSYSDRMRYYWPDPGIAAAEERLYTNLERSGIPLPLISQYLPDQYARVRRGTLSPTPRDLVRDRIRDVLRDYAAACRTSASPSASQRPAP